MLFNGKLFKIEIGLNVIGKTPRSISRDVWGWILGKRLAKVIAKVVDQVAWAKKRVFRIKIVTRTPAGVIGCGI